jgi:cytoplasmic iron level regulating protein YaaA (DUF328/UPF0246 family)
VLPAWQRYDGVVFQHLDPGSFSTEEFASASERIVVVSGLGGMFGFTDPVPEYRLKMGASLAPVGSVAKFWYPQLTEQIETAGSAVIDLLPLEHAAAVRRPAGVEWVRVELTGSDGRRAGHHAKAAKGRLARALLDAPDGEMRGFLAAYRDDEGFTLTLR